MIPHTGRRYTTVAASDGPAADTVRGDISTDARAGSPGTTAGAADATGGPERVLMVSLVALFFGMGYLWAAGGHSPATAWDGATWLDARIPLVPAFIVFYMLGYFFVFAPAFVLRQRRDFEAGMAVFVGMLALAFLTFHFFPLFIQKEYALGTDFLSTLTRHQQRTDSSFNNLPSLHVALNLFAWLLLYIRARKVAVWCLPLLVCTVLSTLLVKQHLIVDVVAGALLAGIGFSAWLWLRQRDSARVVYLLVLALIVTALLVNMPGVGKGIGITYGLVLKMVGL